MPTIRKTTPGAETIHGHGRVTGGETIEVDPDTADFLVNEQGTYERIVDVDSPDGSDHNPDGSDHNPDGSPPDEPETEAHDPTIEEHINNGVCPWCPEDDRYEGDGVAQHAASAHPDAWDAYKSGDA